MSDFTTYLDNSAQTGDWKLVGTQLATGADLVTAILISVFTDRIANADDVIPDGTNDPRGWVGDLGATYPIGSRMWLISRAKQTPDVLKRAKDYLVEALQWLIDDGVVAKFDIVTEFGPGQLRAGVTAWQPDGSQVSQSFSWVWASLVPTNG